MRVVFMGTPEFAVNVLDGLISNGYDVVAVVSQPDKEVGRHHVLTPTPVKVLAESHGIDVLQPIKIRVDYKDVLEYKPDIIITCAYGQIVPDEVLNYPKYGCINVHASLLPKLRGGAPIHKALIDGYHETGVTIMYMDSKMDNGDIISSSKTEILDSDNLESLSKRLSIMGSDLLIKTLPHIINGTNDRVEQDLSEVTYAYNITREEEHIDFNKSSREVFNLIRGLSPVPSANANIDGREMKIYSSILSDDNYSGVPGEIVSINKMGIVVKCGSGAITITSLKPFGKKRMDAVSYSNGVHDLIGKVFK